MTASQYAATGRLSGCASSSNERWHQRAGLSPCCPAVKAPPRVRVTVTVRVMAMARSGAGKREAVRTSAALAEKTEAEMGAEVTAVARAAV
eukprot:scaffold99359_cov54-Phaeocystis_antarctica.AAC.1